MSTSLYLATQRTHLCPVLHLRCQLLQAVLYSEQIQCLILSRVWKHSQRQVVIPPPSVPIRLPIPRFVLLHGAFFFIFFQAVFYMECRLMVGFFVAYLRGRLRRPRDWARWVIICPSFEFISMNDPPRRNGPALLWPELSHLPQRIPSRRTGKCVTPPSFGSSSSDHHV